jgi:hypothetical protein
MPQWPRDATVPAHAWIESILAQRDLCIEITLRAAESAVPIEGGTRCPTRRDYGVPSPGIGCGTAYMLSADGASPSSCALLSPQQYMACVVV